MFFNIDDNNSKFENTLITDKFLPSMKEVEKIGFSLQKNTTGGYKVILPKNWYTKPTMANFSKEIYDPQDRLRGYFRSKYLFADEQSLLILKRYYDVIYEQERIIKNNICTINVYFGHDDKERQFIGRIKCEMPFYNSLKNMYTEKAEKFGDNNIPNWRNIQSYWDEKTVYDFKNVNDPKIKLKKN